ncbi:hypothetical protein ACLI4R_17020 [Natrialbaceae archaeon A-chndr2]
MSGEQDEMEWVVAPVDPLILNALVQRNQEDSTALADESSRTILTDAFNLAVDLPERESFDEIASAVRDGSESVGAYETIESVIGSVRDELASRDVIVKITHENVLTFDSVEAALYTFSRTRDPESLGQLELSDDVLEHVTAAFSPLADKNWEQAADELMEAVSAAKLVSEGVVTRTLAALCYHWAGDDEQTIDLVGEAVTLDSTSWLPWLPGYSADADPAYATSDQFREGKYGVATFLRYISKVPERASITPFVGYPDGDTIQWFEREPTETCIPVEHLDTETHIRFEITGPVDAFPAFQAYYLGLGIVDLEVDEVRDVLNVLGDGPTGEAVTEAVRFEYQSD